MAYPLSIASLHFQYKTAFDVLKSYLPDKNDDELSQMVLDFKSKKEADKPPKKESKKEPTKATTETPKKEEPSDSPKEVAETPKKTKKSKV